MNSCSGKTQKNKCCLNPIMVWKNDDKLYCFNHYIVGAKRIKPVEKETYPKRFRSLNYQLDVTKPTFVFNSDNLPPFKKQTPIIPPISVPKLAVIPQIEKPQVKFQIKPHQSIPLLPSLFESPKNIIPIIEYPITEYPITKCNSHPLVMELIKNVDNCCDKLLLLCQKNPNNTSLKTINSEQDQMFLQIYKESRQYSFKDFIRRNLDMLMKNTDRLITLFRDKLICTSGTNLSVYDCLEKLGVNRRTVILFDMEFEL